MSIHLIARGATRHFGALLLGCVIGGCGAAQLPPPVAPPSTDLDGTWQIVSTNFSMWFDEDKRCPIRRYAPRKMKNRVTHSIAYLDKGERQAIHGVDTLDPNDHTRGRWRGAGWLFFYASDWSIRAGRDAWRIVYFDETLFSPAGVDILTRSVPLDAAAWSAIDRAVADDSLLALFAAQLVRLDRVGCVSDG